MLVAALAGTFWYARKGTVKPHGPVVLVSIDTLRADRLPIYGIPDRVGHHGTLLPNPKGLIGPP